MYRFENSTPRVALGIAAVGMTAIMLALSVIMPAAMNSHGLDARVLNMSVVRAPGSNEADIIPARIDVLATREPAMIPVTYRKQG